MFNKKAFILLAGILCFHWAYAQDETDALRYSFLSPGGSARLQAIGGAGVSLGGDPSMVNMNPAAIGLFKSNDLSITPGLNVTTHTGDYLDQTGSDSKTNFYIQQLGLVIASDNQNRNSNSKWKQFNFSIGLNRLANFNKNIFYQGNNSNSSYADNYSIELNSQGYTNSQGDLKAVSRNFPYGISQAYETGLIGPFLDDNGNFSYWESLPGDILNNGHSLHQSNTIATKGGLDEFNLSVAGNYDDRLFIGVGLYVPSINFDRDKTFRETNKKDEGSVLEYYEVANHLHTDGVGINGKIGLIYLINSNWRFGASFHSPTIYSMHDTYTTTIRTQSTDLGFSSSTTPDFTDGYPGEYDYSLTTPWRAMGGLSYVFGTTSGAVQHGFVSLDYEFVNYGAARFSFNSSSSTADDKAFAETLNNSISQLYKGASNVRLGGEMKFNLLSVRAGIMYMGSPYANTEIKGDQMRYSVGIGIRNKGFYADLTYVYTDQGEYHDQPYFVDENDLNIHSPEPAVIQGNSSTFLLTFGFLL